MGISISSALSSVPINTADSGATPKTVQPTNNAPSAAADTVKLTMAEQVYNLYTQGQTVPEIATGLNLTVELVNSYLGLTTTT